MKRKLEIEKIYSLAPMQEGMLFHALMDNRSSAYFQQNLFSLKGEVEPTLLEESLNRVAQRYDVFRTVFRWENVKQPMQIVFKKRPFKINYEDISHLTPAHREKKLNNIKTRDREQGFDLTKDFLVRVSLFKTETNEYKMLWSFHHILMDGWCLGIVFKDLLQIYQGLKEGKTLELPAVTPYREYIKWLKTQDKGKALDYWRCYLEGYEQQAGLPGDHNPGRRDRTKGYRLEEHHFFLQEPLTSGLREIAGKNRVTFNMLCQVLWGILVQRYNNTDDVVFGTIVSGRPSEIEGIERMVGLFINIIPVRIRSGEGQTFSQLLEKNKRENLLLKSYEYFPLADVQAVTPLKNNLLRHIVVFEDYPLEKEISHINRGRERCRFRVQGIDTFEQSNYDFNLQVAPGKQLHLKFSYNSLVYAKEFVTSAAVHFEILAARVVGNPDIAIKTLGIISSEEKKQVLAELNNTQVAYPHGKTIAQFFAHQVEQNPDNVAVIGNRHLVRYKEQHPQITGNGDIVSITYTELNRRSGRLAHWLRKKGVGPDTIAALMVERSLEMIIAVLGIVKAGGAYLPIEPGYPEERINYMLADSSANLLVTTQMLTEATALSSSTLTSTTTCRVSPANLAYIIYTSGTTGRPKGVMIEHKNVVRLLFNNGFLFDFNCRDSWSMFHAYNFDFSVWEMYGALLYGGKLVIIPKQVVKDPGIFLEVLKQQQVSVLNQTPTAFYKLIDQEMTVPGSSLNLKYIIFGGEALSPLKLKKWKQKYPGTRLINMYGITETTVHSTYKEIGAEEIETNRGNIGKPLPTSSAYVMDRDLHLLPPGVPGELYVGGEGVARGYLNNPGLTRQRFIPDPYGTGQWLYKSGDFCRFAAGSQLEYLGRVDDQVQIKGFRVEPGEVQRQLIEHEAVKEAVVTAGPGEDEPGEKNLCAYIVLEKGFDIFRLRDYLAGKLPDYMIPLYFTRLGKIPLTPNGKVDRAALPRPRPDGTGECVLPKTTLEKELAEIWKEVLKLEKPGITNSFFHVGGDSIKAIRLISRINARLNIHLKIQDIYNADTIEKLAREIHRGKNLNLHQRILTDVKTALEALKRRIISSGQLPDDFEDIYPMSDIQKGMIFYSLKNGDDALYHDQFWYPLQFREFDMKLFKQALVLVMEKHQVLRVSFNIKDFEEQVQIVHKHVPPPLAVYDISSRQHREQQEYLKKFQARSRKNPFQLSVPPLWRMNLFALGNDRFYFLWEFHHAILDGWSNASLITELNNIYLKLKKGMNYIPPKLKSTYYDFIIRQRFEKSNKEAIDYWKNQLVDYKRLHFPTVKNREHRGSGVSRLIYRFDRFLLEKLKETAVKYRSSVKNLCFAAYVYMLNMISFDTDMVVGMVTHVRPACKDGDKILGCFLNTVPVRFRVPGNIRWCEYISRVDEKLAEVKKYEGVSFFEIVRISGEKPQDRNPIFDTLFNYVDFHIYREIDPVNPGEADWGHSPVLEGFENTNTFLDFTVNATFDELSLILYYTRPFVGEKLADGLCHYFKQVLHMFTQEPEGVASKDKIIPQQEKQDILYRFNNTGIHWPQDKTIHELFEEQAQRTPDKIAVIGRAGTGQPGSSPSANVQLTYDEVNKTSHRSACLLKEKGTHPDSIVGIMSESSVEMIIGILGILKAGSAYLPIDPQYPQERIDYMLADSGTQFLVTTRPPAEEVKGVGPNRGPSILPTFYPSHSSLAYVTYTSGSTGKPKGVMIRHSAVVNFITGILRCIPFRESHRILSLTTITFDIFVLETLLPLTAGSTVVMGSKEQQSDPAAAAGVIQRENITIFQVTPSRLQLLAAHEDASKSLLSLTYLLVGGEAFPGPLLEKARKITRGKIFNLYGPTETTIWSTVKEVTGKRSLNIGKPIANTRIFILDPAGCLQPIGVPGELYITGAGVARGYLNQPELTAEKFCKNFSLMRSSTTFYRTCDLARWLPDGNIEFAGRIDHQVKIRGFRIELGEIENRLLNHDAVKEAVVTVIEGEENKNLCAYIVPQAHVKGTDNADPFTAAQLRDFLSHTLPDYMLPSFFMVLERVPLTPNGKINRQALPLPGSDIKTGAPYEKPGNPIEEALVRIWSQILNLENVGINENFFELGGHSLEATRMIARVHKELNVQLPLAQIFKSPQIKGLSGYIKGLDQNNGRCAGIGYVEEKEYYGLSSQQKRLYILYRMAPDSTVYNLPTIVKLAGVVDGKQLEAVFKQLIRRHESLRTSFFMKGNKPVQKMHEEVEFNIEYDGVTVKENREGCDDRFIKDFIRPFVLSRAPLLRVGLFYRGETLNNRYILLVDLHHIISDQLSLDILVREFMLLLESKPLPPLTYLYKDYCRWQSRRHHREKDLMNREEAYWLKEFAGHIPVLDLAANFPRPARRDFAGSWTRFEISPQQTRALKNMALEENATLYMVLLALFNVLLSKLADCEDIVVGTDVSGRQHAELEHTMGMFANTLALRNFPGAGKSYRNFLKEVKERTLKAFANQDYPLEDLVEQLAIKRDPGRNPLFDVMFGFQDSNTNPNPGKTSLEAVGCDYEKTTSKFDIILTGINTSNSLHFVLEHSTNLFNKEKIQKIIQIFKEITAAVTDNPDVILKNIEVTHGFAEARNIQPELHLEF
jgi:tyrocidine synthetase-3